MQHEQIVSSLQKVKKFFFYSDNLTDCFFAAESEEIGFFTAESEDVFFPQCQLNRFFTAESEEIVSLLQKVKMFFFRSANLRDYLFILKSKQIGFFTAKCEDILFCVDWFFHCGK